MVDFVEVLYTYIINLNNFSENYFVVFSTENNYIFRKFARHALETKNMAQITLQG